MKLKAFNILLFLLLTNSARAQLSVSGLVIDANTQRGIAKAEVYSPISGALYKTDRDGRFNMEVDSAGNYQLVVFAMGYSVRKQVFLLEPNRILTIELSEISNELSAVEITQQRESTFAISRLRPVEGTSIYAGKKSEVILLDGIIGNLASNNARQVYAQVVGLNIYDSEAAGLQLSIGGRGLDPNRTANFNTRQNGYDISADVLGYPESYYTPPAEALDEIQVIRGAASLQYGTQFGGLINFKMKEANPNQPIAWVSRQTVGSFGLFTSFNSLAGTKDKFSYYTYFNHKQGKGFRPNSQFESNNYYAHLAYEFNQDNRLSLEYTYLNYLAKQPGGLTDTQFDSDPLFSNRTRNWFEVNWNLYSLKYELALNSQSDFSLNLFGLNASRNAVGFRGDVANLNSNPITDIDETNADGQFVNPRDLIRGNFQNWGIESRLLSRYGLGAYQSVFLIGAKFYQANNTSLQGPGTNGVDPDFVLAESQYPDYPNRSDFRFPNLNASIFGENIFYLNDRLSLTPGFRFEYIKTESEGTYNNVVFDNAGNPILNETLEDNRSFERGFLLLGVGLSYDYSDEFEFYANISQNYRSVTFSDIRTVNPSFIIDPEIKDEQGFTTDFGFRGKFNDAISYDFGGFSLLYNDRIGIVLDDRANRVRKNIGSAWIYGAETFFDWDLSQTMNLNAQLIQLRWFANTAFTGSQYLASEDNNISGKKVEFIPTLNLKTGVSFGYNNLLASLQFSYLSEQFTDAENSAVPAIGDARNGLIGEIPAYSVMDLSLAYGFGKWRVELGVNNLLNQYYFTRRATGYPGPGIIPSDPRNYYLTLQFKL